MGFRVHADVLMQEKTSMLPEKIFKGPNSGFGNPRVMVSGTSLWPRACVTGPACLSAADDIPDGPYGVLRTDTVRCFPDFCYFCWANGGHCETKHVPIIPGTNGALLEEYGRLPEKRTIIGMPKECVIFGNVRVQTHRAFVKQCSCQRCFELYRQLSICAWRDHCSPVGIDSEILGVQYRTLNKRKPKRHRKNYTHTTNSRHIWGT
ncbi:hypothetical protein CPAR01_05032 [Colletotrichum paranaense]|uniref:Uncharacterized protein n=1 Tax=Colletotrichum paranaense TaxID=1914294 RepID=A0ABQ9SQ47_9PEZI|nr:uncharacterized protein CPAR01_05032 [Colletotrichum paranaense]KAK1541645.1 hypothetical protein CPAR01_05032 [Colletotrichum paranaense]